MASFSIPLTGLKADSTALNTVANDLSNMSTTAFKAQSTNFSDLFYQQVGTNGAGDLVQVGAGVKVASNEIDFTAGTPTSTDVASNVALQGSGFFVVDDGATQFLTRDGDFQTDSTGNLITTNGDNVMGYPAVDRDQHPDRPGTESAGHQHLRDDRQPGFVCYCGHLLSGADQDIRFAGQLV
jgi:flagellar hook protein FlgE